MYILHTHNRSKYCIFTDNDIVLQVSCEPVFPVRLFEPEEDDKNRAEQLPLTEEREEGEKEEEEGEKEEGEGREEEGERREKGQGEEEREGKREEREEGMKGEREEEGEEGEGEGEKREGGKEGEAGEREGKGEEREKATGRRDDHQSPEEPEAEEEVEKRERKEGGRKKKKYQYTSVKLSRLLHVDESATQNHCTMEMDLSLPVSSLLSPLPHEQPHPLLDSWYSSRTYTDRHMASCAPPSLADYLEICKNHLMMSAADVAYNHALYEAIVCAQDTGIVEDTLGSHPSLAAMSSSLSLQDHIQCLLNFEMVNYIYYMY